MAGHTEPCTHRPQPSRWDQSGSKAVKGTQLLTAVSPSHRCSALCGRVQGDGGAPTPTSSASGPGL